MSFLTMRIDKSLIEGLTAAAGLTLDYARGSLTSSDAKILDVLRNLPNVN